MLPEKDVNRTNKEQGMYRKFEVSRTDGRELDSEVFVLEYQKCPHARKAMEAYMESCKDEYPDLSKDIKRRLKS